MPDRYDTIWKCDLYKANTPDQPELIGTETVVAENVPPYVTAPFSRTFFASKMFDGAQCKLVSKKLAPMQ
jgi:hypothetical protein